MTDSPSESWKRESWKRTKARHAKNHKRPRPLIETPIGRKLIGSKDLLKSFANYLAGNSIEKPPPPPGDLGQLFYKLSPEDQAAAVLMPLLDCIFRGWKGDDTPSAEMLLCKTVGQNLHDRLQYKGLLTKERQIDAELWEHKKPLSKDQKKQRAAQQKRRRKWRKFAWRFVELDWTPEECVQAGAWLLELVRCLECFSETSSKELSRLSPEWLARWQATIEQIREDLLRHDQVHMPHLTPPPDWTGWRTQYDNRLQATFVGGGRHKTRRAIEAAFARRPPSCPEYERYERHELPPVPAGGTHFEHARGINALQKVPLRIDTQILELVEQFAVKIMRERPSRIGSSSKANRQRRLDKLRVSDDISVAKWISDRPFYLSYNCDFRGRLNPIPHFNYAREDHVRALFRFANGMRIGWNDLEWLEIHCANCEGSTDKKPWAGRIDWVAENREVIQRIADDPVGTFDLWKDVSKPFRYVAACRELAAAWADPNNFVTHLPIAFDGTCNGTQHLALLVRDAVAGKKVNLTDLDCPQDIYSEAANLARLALEADPSEWAKWWRERLKDFEPKQIRALLKSPVMTFAYNVGEWGATDQIFNEYRELTAEEPSKKTLAACRYLATKVLEAAEDDTLLRKPKLAMEYICALAERCTLENRFLEWTSQTGFPVCNLYQKPNEMTVYTGAKRFQVANGYLPNIREEKARNSSAPNFVHSRDAAHLVLCVNAAMSEGITNIVTVHDSFACLAPQAKRVNEIIRTQLALMYAHQDHLADLRAQNNISDIAQPAFGDLDPLEVQNAEYCWS